MLGSGAVSWRNAKQTLIATFTIEDEFALCFEATSYGVWLKSFMSGLRIIDSISGSLRIYCIIQLLYFWLRTIKVVIEVNISTSNT